MAEQKKSGSGKNAGAERDESSREASQKWPSREEIEKFKVKESRNGMPGYGQPDVER